MAITASITQENGGPTVTIHAMLGWINGRQQVADVYHRLGQSGAGVQSLGFRSKPSSVTVVVVCADYSTALNTSGQLNQMRARYVTVTDPFGTVNRCVVHDADARVFAGKHGYGGTMYPYRVEAQLVLEYVETPAA